MRVYALGETLGFDLTNTSELIPELAECVKNALEVEAERRPPPAAAPASPASGNAELQLAATRIASNLLLAAHLQNARLLSPAETPTALRGHGVAWTSDAGSGAVAIIQSSSAADPEAVASSLISSDATACKGEFASARSTDTVDNHLLATAFTGCKDAGGAAAVRYVVLRAANGGFIVFALEANPAGSVPAAGSPLADAAFRSAAVEAAYSH
ncbi:MAG: hypothetical protein ACRD6W_16735, partial [Nitrososphaerales archaeon]